MRDQFERIRFAVHRSGSNFVQQRLPDVDARLLDERDRRLAAPERRAEQRRQMQPRRAAADDNDPMQRRIVASKGFPRCFRTLGLASTSHRSSPAPSPSYYPFVCPKSPAANGAARGELARFPVRFTPTIILTGRIAAAMISENRKHPGRKSMRGRIGLAALALLVDRRRRGPSRTAENPRRLGGAARQSGPRSGCRRRTSPSISANPTCSSRPAMPARRR